MSYEFSWNGEVCTERSPWTAFIQAPDDNGNVAPVTDREQAARICRATGAHELLSDEVDPGNGMWMVTIDDIHLLEELVTTRHLVSETFDTDERGAPIPGEVMIELTR